MAVLNLMLLAAFSGSPNLDPSFNCSEVAYHLEELSRDIRSQTDEDKQDEQGVRLIQLVSELYPRRRTCVVSEVVPILTRLADEPDANKAIYASAALAELGVDARPALPTLRRAAERGRIADDEWTARLKAEHPGQPIIVGAGLEMTIRGTIGEIENAYDSKPVWQDGLCFRVERRGSREFPDFRFRVISSLADSASCSDVEFGQSPSWTYSGPFGAEKFTSSSTGLMVARSGLSKLLDQSPRISQLCPVSSRTDIPIDRVLAESNLQFVYENEGGSFGAAFDFRDEANSRIVYVGFEFQGAGAEGAKDLREIDCGSRPAP